MSAPSGPRLAPITSERWDDDVRAALSAGFGPGAADRLLADPETPLPNVLGTMMNHPRLLAHWLAFNGKLLRAAQELLPGVVELLADARYLGLKVAVASSSPRSWVERHLVRLRILDEFHCIRCAEDVAQTKPQLHRQNPVLLKPAATLSGCDAKVSVWGRRSGNTLLIEWSGIR